MNERPRWRLLNDGEDPPVGRSAHHLDDGRRAWFDDLDDDDAADGSAAPVYLITHARWLLWRTVTKRDRKTGETRSTKVPISFFGGKACDVTAPTSWTTYDKVVGAMARTPGAWDGPGFVLGVIEPTGEVVIGLDLDTCIDVHGAIADWALLFLTAMLSYAEVSPSGTGIKIIARIRLADLPAVRRLLDIAEGDREQARTRVFGARGNGQHAPSAQLFLQARYFTITGRRWADSPDDVTLLSLDQIAELAALFGPKERRGNSAHRAADAEDDDAEAPDDAVLIAKLDAELARNVRLRVRWDGGVDGLDDVTRSGRDMSVVALLRRAGFTKGETYAALCKFEHGKAASEPGRYFGEMWRRTKATPRQDPEPPPGWEDQHPAPDAADAEQPAPEAHANPEPEEEEQEEEDDWPEPMTLAAFHGLFGEAVGEIMPHTEADPHGLLLQLLTSFGNKVGRGPHYRVGAVQHATNIYTLMAGATSRARKGTADSEIRRLFATDANDPWQLRCVQAGLSTGEGLIHAVRDERWGKNKKGELELIEEGAADKRLLAIEGEFASVLQVMKREGNTLSPVLRVAWDRGELQTLTRSSPLRTTGALVSVIAHVTIEELRSGVDRIALSNGLLNRFLFVVVRRSRLLPHGGNVSQDRLQQIGERLSEAVRAAKLVGAVGMTPAARDMWSSLYPELTTDHPGLFGSLIARAEAHTVRLALLYALADQRQAIEPVHLEAALAIWRYSEASARVLFGSLVGDPVADSLLTFLRPAGNAGMTRTELYNVLGRNVSSARIQIALDLLLKQSRVRRAKGGRTGQTGTFTETWFYIRGRQP